LSKIESVGQISKYKKCQFVSWIMHLIWCSENKKLSSWKLSQEGRDFTTRRPQAITDQPSHFLWRTYL